MSKAAKHLLIGSTEAYSGKSAMILGLAQHLQQQGIDIAYGKPIGTCPSESGVDSLDEDVRLMARILHLDEKHLRPTLFCLDDAAIQQRINGEDRTDYAEAIAEYRKLSGGELVLLEGPGTLEEGGLFNLSLLQVAQEIEASVILVSRYRSALIVDALLAAKQRLGKYLAGVLINDVPESEWEMATTQIKPFLEGQGIPVFGLLPRSDLLRSVSVRELVHQLKAQVLCRPDRLDLMVETLTIGAMNVNSALKYFQNARNMAVVTGGDRTDLQLAALETSTQCLILTGQVAPSPQILSRAEDLETPILSVDLDTLSTVEIIDRAFGQVRLHEPIKVQCIQQLMAEHVDILRLVAYLGLEPVAQH